MPVGLQFPETAKRGLHMRWSRGTRIAFYTCLCKKNYDGDWLSPVATKFSQEERNLISHERFVCGIDCCMSSGDARDPTRDKVDAF